MGIASFEPQEEEYDVPRSRDMVILSFLSLGSKVCDIVKFRKFQYFGSWATNTKTKDTFFSSTFKV